MHTQTVKLQKIGNSFMATIPIDLVRASKLSIGDDLVFSKAKKYSDKLLGFNIKIKKVRKKKPKLKSFAQANSKPTLSIPNFSMKQVLKWKHEARYDR
ncbi:AbrB/MazE/SpoVT family DNA-binding domain-containing protein [Patescibacteria group bacterium]|nr:AbrB/MazE/SpoVT family DNA-binding domain-containing protein [Patescibacteria group bacterium]MCG2702631.1 AbrB/MazE/SpoVT family DNA-binding domain-containing protein [Candidatus Parcubacteria bacterium]MBU4209923.1 AbrB/MazE/SpoVT family DNA-binding domain-containing protein [Patescibacteria group bacterium]MBU4265475.1 AbrB/MazE/SpoVT family DNA-binding domain-containing protein [Patescibacteria group bacterium]MBU4390525.1 AbrB/MazE/SpoVT family DNA-binding domain-containing protein [Pat